uniref:Conotoxin-like protein 2 n=1 Tax=Spilarctia obliqua nucleopolyhedrovirus TaxID=1638618 RepID=A0A7G9U8G4_9ABAC|nr:conotoxin-like protein 2 [Spilarctia obliqua nucleopolyhedrovirus]
MIKFTTIFLIAAVVVTLSAQYVLACTETGKTVNIVTNAVAAHVPPRLVFVYTDK